MDVINSELSLDQIKEELVKVNEKIAIAEKRLQTASKQFIAQHDSEKGQQSLLEVRSWLDIQDDEEEQEHTTCERQLSVYGDAKCTLDETKRHFEAQSVALEYELSRLSEEYNKEREILKNLLLSIKMPLLPKDEREKFKEVELESLMNKQAELESTVIRLRTQILLAESAQRHRAGPSKSVEILQLREQHSGLGQQLQQTYKLLEKQQRDREIDGRIVADSKIKCNELNAKIRSLQSDLDMAKLEYADVCREYKKTQELRHVLRQQVKDAEISQMRSTLNQQKDSLNYRIIKLDVEVKRERQKCDVLHKILEKRYREIYSSSIN